MLINSINNSNYTLDNWEAFMEEDHHVKTVLLRQVALAKRRNESVHMAGMAGIFTGIYTSLNKDDIIRTIVLTAISASVSFIVSFLLNKIKERLKR